jgi:methylthioribose-1-phosphate isomerase
MPEAEVNLFEYVDRLRIESKEEHVRLHERISNMKDELLSEIKEMRKEQIEINQKMDERVTKLERWKWSVVGGALVVGFLLADGIHLIDKLIS